MAEKEVYDPEPMGPVKGLAYVDIDWIAKELGCSARNVRIMVENEKFPVCDSISPEGDGRPKQLWLKHKVVAAIHKMLQGSGKKGIAALV
ncbi:MAG: hypothetical protein U5N53_09040 [Mycobacterium sp.]|nr:hypothetical protein [Mycobacterium sp.]